jgi:D-aspartate ligase
MGQLESPAVVLTSAYYYGTLAAARSLGERGIPVIVADYVRLGPALWSRYVTRRVLSPKDRPMERFMDWLLDFGRSEPGHVLYATRDDHAWAFAEREKELRECFRVLTPPFATVARLLDKRTLYAACTDAGLVTPWTGFPRCLADVEDMAGDAPYPVIIKPRTQVGFTLRKGVIAASARELSERYAEFVRSDRHDVALLQSNPDVEYPMVQEFCGAYPMYCMSGYCDPRRNLFVTRAARKLVQWPRQAGIGICVENTTVDQVLAQRVVRLCELTGFYGVFEAEFVMRGDVPLLVDFNPRFFGQMGFDAARQLPSAYLVYLAAIEDFARLEQEVELARSWRAPGRMLFVDRTALAVAGIADWMVGRSAPELTLPKNGQRDSTWVIDFSADERDWVPGFLDRTIQVERALRHGLDVLRTAARGT